ncbi:MAG: amino acid decarboxylase [Candidatus Ventricola sp.]|nr:amino acid decarboxylase [Candidatus Ventricola sp.]
MNTPVADFVRRYAASGTARLHMPGHKGRASLGCEAFDITEVAGADALYEADGILAQSEANAASLFSSQRTVYSTEGSSQCIRAMLQLCLLAQPQSGRAVVLAARNVHKAFVYAAALLDIDVQWLWPEAGSASLCACPITPDALARALGAMPEPPAAVYVTSPDYLGNEAGLAALAQVCHAHGTLLAVDNAHGAYLRFLSPSRHPLDLGADICCDSAHKTLPVLTGGAYLHIARRAPAVMAQQAKQAMALFGSTSPSYLTLASLDLCNAALAGDYPRRIAETAARLDALRAALRDLGWRTLPSDPLRVTLDAASGGLTGTQLAQRLRAGGVECEYADEDALVLMATPENDEADFDRVLFAAGEAGKPRDRVPLPVVRAPRACSIRQALLAPQELLPAQDALGRICGAPTVACPPAIPVAVSGEVITREAIEVFCRCGIETVSVVRA